MSARAINDGGPECRFRPRWERLQVMIRTAVTGRSPAQEVPVFFFYNSRWGCMASLLVSAAVTLLVLFLLGWI
ncbi:hypothetical protein GCM10009602_07880 [Nocardiopsis tropica]